MRKEVREKYPHLYDRYKEKSKAAALEYYNIHKEDILAARKNDPEFLPKKRTYFNQWKKDNAEMFNETVYRWKATASGVYSTMTSGAKSRDIDISISRHDFMEWFYRQPETCAYCGLTIDEIGKLPADYVRRSGAKRFSVDRKDNSKGYSEDNIILCCYMCNTIKNSFLTYAEMVVVGALVLKPKLRKFLEEPC